MEEKINWKEVPVGTNFSGFIGDTYVVGKIQKEGGDIFLCQNNKNGMDCRNKLGYDYSYTIDFGSVEDMEKNNVKQIVLDIPKAISEVSTKEITKQSVNNNRYLLINTTKTK